jgi:hypothetical protein
VAGRCQRLARLAPDAGIEQDLQITLSVIGGSTRSCATSL